MTISRAAPGRRSAVAAGESEAWLTLMLIVIATVVSLYDLLLLLVSAT